MSIRSAPTIPATSLHSLPAGDRIYNPIYDGLVRDIRMLRIEELNDLMPAVQHGERE